MNDQEKLMSLLLDNINYPLVYVDTDHIIRYMNKKAKTNSGWKKHGELIGKSVFECHNENSKEMMLKFFKRLQDGEREIRFENSETRRIYMTGIFDSGDNLVGYYERYEFWD